MRRDLPQIWLTAQRVRAAVEEAVKGFPRYHRYASGADLRADARHIVRCMRRAWLQRDLERRHELAQQLSEAIDELKDSMQLAKDANAFRSFGEFDAVARLVNSLGKQCGGWLKEFYSKGQNAQAARPPEQRAMTLSSRTASQGATP